MNDQRPVLIHTSQYPDERGGIATYTKLLLTILNDLNLNAEVVKFKNHHEASKLRINKDFKAVINLHSYGVFATKYNTGTKTINILHGHEVALSSPSFLKRYFKLLYRKKYFNLLESSDLNIFISEFTFNFASSMGLKVNYSRDLIFHNIIDTSTAKHFNTELGPTLRFCCICRDEPHKNLDEVLRFCELAQDNSQYAVQLFVTSGRLRSKKIEVVAIENSENSKRDSIYQNSHFNILFSKESKKGPKFEGFGLSCLEAGQYGTPSLVLPTGGLRENIHNEINGYFMPIISNLAVKDFCSTLNSLEYKKLREETYHHTLSSHGLELGRKFWSKILCPEKEKYS